MNHRLKLKIIQYETGVLLQPEIDTLAKILKVKHQDLLDIEKGIMPISGSLRGKIIKEMGVSPKWFDTGEGPVLDEKNGAFLQDWQGEKGGDDYHITLTVDNIKSLIAELTEKVGWDIYAFCEYMDYFDSDHFQAVLSGKHVVDRYTSEMLYHFLWVSYDWHKHSQSPTIGEFGIEQFRKHMNQEAPILR